MKKIIELANEVCNDLESQDGIWLDSAIMLRDAINVRRKLEQTPITEEWLKEHGWRQISRITYTKTSGFGMTIRHMGDGEWLWITHSYGDSITMLKNLAQLLDASAAE